MERSGGGTHNRQTRTDDRRQHPVQASSTCTGNYFMKMLWLIITMWNNRRALSRLRIDYEAKAKELGRIQNRLAAERDGQIVVVE